MRKAGLLGIALIGSLIWLQPGVSALAGDPPPASAAAPAAPAPPCTPVVRMFGQPLCRELLKMDNTDLARYLKSLPEDQRKLIEEQARLGNMRKVKAVIWQQALVKKFGIKAISPTDEEIDTYRSNFNNSLDKSYIADRQTVDLLQGMLAKNVYSKANETKMRRLLEAATMSMKLYGERQQHTEAIPKQFQYLTEATERMTARTQLVSWKSDKILYDTYGGRLVPTDTGVTPIDAYAKFLKYIREEGKLEITDDEYKDVFRETEEFIAAKHEISPEDESVATQYFTNPSWQFNLSNNEKRVEDMKRDLDKIPVLGIKDGAAIDEKDLIGKQSKPRSPLLSKVPPQ
jgi:hypothetical protein